MTDIAKDVSPTWSLHVANDTSGSVVHELNADLRDASSGPFAIRKVSAFSRTNLEGDEIRRWRRGMYTSAAQHSRHLYELDGDF